MFTTSVCAHVKPLLGPFRFALRRIHLQDHGSIHVLVSFAPPPSFIHGTLSPPHLIFHSLSFSSPPSLLHLLLLLLLLLLLRRI